MRAGERHHIGAPAVARDEAGGDLGQHVAVADRLALQGRLGEAGKPGRADQRHLAAAGIMLDQPACVVARHGSRRRQNRDEAVAAARGGGLHRRNGADEGDGETGPQRREHQRRGRVAGDDDEVGMEARDQPLHHREHAGDQRRLAQPSIGKGGVVGGVDDVGIGAAGDDFAQHGQAAETGIEQEDGRAALRHHRAAMAVSGEEIDLHGVGTDRGPQSPIGALVR